MPHDVTTGAYRDTARCLVCGKRFARLRRNRLTCSDACRQARSRRLRAATPPFPEGPFDLILADPPPLFETRGRVATDGSSRAPKYETMDWAALCRLPVAKLAARNAVLVIWVFGPAPEMTARLARAWGFGPPGELFVWNKLTRAAKLKPGMGYNSRKTSESVWVASRGKGLMRLDKGVYQGLITDEQLVETIVSRPREHSRKPDELYAMLDRLYGRDLRRIELFARRTWPGYVAWGNELLPNDPDPMLPFEPEELFEDFR